ncbi:MAG: SDR family NAD(P)-dependent oxidoreductase [Hyphomicrobiales bacterium]|nr:SDR family NAD(P)-dependent oxidoreductase [Hyphomicrobiales bacterium]
MAPSARQKAAEDSKSAVAPGWVLVTGASAGIGRELARAFASKGRNLVLLARSHDTTTELARELIMTKAVNVKTIPADLSVAGAAEAIFEGLTSKGISVDILVNNAGVLFEGEFSSIPLEEHLRLLQINVVALTALTRLFLPLMLQRRGGRILNVASTSAFMPVPRLAAYAAAKAYVLSLTESLSEELRGSGVTATALCPGFTDTSMMRGSRLGKAAPSIMVMSPAAVAEQGCAACLAGETICVPGVANKLIASGTPLMPRALVRGIGGMVISRGWDRIGNAWRAAASPSDKGGGR